MATLPCYIYMYNQTHTHTHNTQHTSVAEIWLCRQFANSRLDVFLWGWYKEPTSDV